LIRIPNQASANDIAAATKKADQVYSQINAGNNFAVLAKQYSDDLISARVGGEMGWMSASNLESGYLRAIGSLKVGQSSKPIRTPYGFVILHVDAMEPAQVAPFQSVSSQIMTTLKNQRAEQTFFDQREQLANLAFANPNSLDVAAQTLNLPIQATDSFSRQGTKEGITANKNVITTAFSADVLNGHDNSQLIEVTPDRVIVLRVTDHQKSSQIPINNVMGQIKMQLMEQSARFKAKQQAENIVSKLGQGQSLAALSQSLRFPMITKKDIKRNNKELVPEMVKQVFRLSKPRMGAQQNSNSSSAFALPSGDYVVAQLNRVQDGDFSAANEQERRYLDDQLETSFGQLDYAFYVQSAMKNADIEIKRDEIKSSTALNPDEENAIS
jgi:peptidyl-prolyl cis-trans isomerase D